MYNLCLNFVQLYLYARGSRFINISLLLLLLFFIKDTQQLKAYVAASCLNRALLAQHTHTHTPNRGRVTPMMINFDTGPREMDSTLIGSGPSLSP